MISHEINKPILSDGIPIWHLTDGSGQAADVGSSGDNAERDQLLLRAPPLLLLLAEAETIFLLSHVC
jgi:hypothetical protein